MLIKNKNVKRNKTISYILLCILCFTAFSLAIYTLLKPDNETLNGNTNKNETSYQDDSDKRSSPGQPTKTKDKTPIQYEGEQIEGGPTTNNEHFRIPEGQ